MKTEWLYKTFSLAIILVLFYLFYNVISPFLITIAWAMVLSITFYPLYRLLLKYVKRPWAASLITLILILVIILGPFSLIVGSLVNEIDDVYRLIEDRGYETIIHIQNHPRLAALFEKIGTIRIFQGIDLQQGALNTLKVIGKTTAEHISNIFKDAVLMIVGFIIMCITTFYFLKDGNTLANFIKKLLPFSETQKDRLEQRVRELVVAAIYGGLAVAVAQGTLGGIAFLLFGLPSPVFWGTAMAIFSLVPLFGCTIIWLPTGLFLLLSGSYAMGAGFLIYCVLLIATIDNIIKPLVIGGRTKLHTLLVFFSVLGGMKFLGFLGFILGPLITALCLSLLEIYTFEEPEKEEVALS
jgi:predicted PurR-regulated permease PerM